MHHPDGGSQTGRFKEEVLNEKVLSTIIEMIVETDKAPEVLKTIRQVASELDCVFSVDLISHVNKDGSVAASPSWIRSAGLLPPMENSTPASVGRWQGRCKP